jgi:hypothetical protein
MNSVELVVLVESTWKTAIPDKRLMALKAVRVAVATDLLALFDALVDAKIAGIADDPNSIVLVLVHGIQTDGAWHRLVQKELEDVPNINVVSVGYECVTPAQLFSPFRGAPVAKIAREMREARQMDPKARLMVISYIVSKILRADPDIKFERIIFCGSIVPRHFQWAMFAQSMSRLSIVNDVGTEDFYPVLATLSTFGYGSSGRLGFQTARVTDRYFRYGHSDFFNSNHVRKFWRPFITDGQIEKSDWDIQKPKSSVLVLMLSHPWIGRPMAYLAAFFSLVLLAQLLPYLARKFENLWILFFGAFN